MTRSTPRNLLLLTVLVGSSLGVVAQSTVAEGILERSGAGDMCNQNLTHQVIDTCTGYKVYLRSAPDTLLCKNVRVEGFDVGVECVILEITSIEETALRCPLEVLYLTVDGGPYTWLSWWPTPCAETYDVIRGDLPGPTSSGGIVDLGPVVCRENDLPNPGTYQDPDTEVPVQGRAFFYLVRPYGTRIGQLGYGRSSAGEDRVPSTGDCPSAP